jgi:hypothetical protein
MTTSGQLTKLSRELGLFLGGNSRLPSPISASIVLILSHSYTRRPYRTECRQHIAHDLCDLPSEGGVVSLDI